jgi:hypothetical protein
MKTVGQFLFSFGGLGIDALYYCGHSASPWSFFDGDAFVPKMIAQTLEE